MNFSPKDIIEALYLAVLNRAPDSEGLTNYIRSLETGELTLKEIAESFHDSAEHQRHMQQPNGLSDHSQQGEFQKILSAMMGSGSKHNVIVDVGARGRDRSNSYDLLQKFGWRGLLVEANPALRDQIDREFKGLDFILVNCAVGPEAGKLPFYIGINDDVSSLNPDAARGWGEIQAVVDVDVRRLPDILQEHDVPSDFDVLSIDIESLDVPVLNDLIENSDFRPEMVIIEVVHGMETTSDISSGKFEAWGMSPSVRAVYKISDFTKSNLFLTRR